MPNDEELEAMEDQGGTDIVDPEEFEKMREEIDKMTGRLSPLATDLTVPLGRWR